MIQKYLKRFVLPDIFLEPDSPFLDPITRPRVVDRRTTLLSLKSITRPRVVDRRTTLLSLKSITRPRVVYRCTTLLSLKSITRPRVVDRRTTLLSLKSAFVLCITSYNQSKIRRNKLLFF